MKNRDSRPSDQRKRNIGHKVRLYYFGVEEKGDESRNITRSSPSNFPSRKSPSKRRCKRRHQYKALLKYRLFHYKMYSKSAVQTATELYHEYNALPSIHKRIAKELPNMDGGTGIANWKAYGLIRLGLLREGRKFDPPVRIKENPKFRPKRRLKPEKLKEIRERRKNNG